MRAHQERHAEKITLSSVPSCEINAGVGSDGDRVRALGGPHTQIERFRKQPEAEKRSERLQEHAVRHGLLPLVLALRVLAAHERS